MATDEVARPRVGITPTLMSEDEKLLIAAEMEERLAEATTVDEIFAESSTLGLADIANIPVKVNGVRFLPSDERYANQPGATGYYVVMQTDHGVVTTGARTIVQKLYKAAEHQHLPLTLRFWQSEKETSAGYRPWNVSLAK